MICYRPAQAHHLTFVEDDGLSGMRRSGDQHAVPLCDDHHRHLHAYGNEKRWWAMEGIDPIAWIEMFKRNEGKGYDPEERTKESTEEEVLQDEE